MNITFEQAIESYLKFVSIKNKKSSFRSIESRIRTNILEYVKDKNIYDFNCFDYIEWQTKINKKNYCYKYKSTLHNCFVIFLNYCIKFYGLEKNVASDVGNFKNENIDKDNGHIWTYQEFSKFINVVDDFEYNIFFKFLFFTGCRLGEATGITFNNIDFENNKIYIGNNATRFFENGKRVITTPKTKKSMRTISIDNKLIDECKKLKEYYITKYDDFNNNFFLFGGKQSFAPTTITRKKDNWCKIANVERIKIHEFRHSHACLLFQNNVPIDEISHRLGHSTISMTMDVYLRFIPKDEKRVIDTLNCLRLSS